MIKVAELVQVYTQNGARTHLAERSVSLRSICGQRAPKAGWWGTGSYLEGEVAETRPLCGYCAAELVKLGLPRRGI